MYRFWYPIYILLASYTFLASPLFLNLSLLLKISVLATFTTLVLQLKFPSLKPLFNISLLILGVFQISTTRLENVYQSSNYDHYLLETRVNSYPAGFYRLGRLLERYLDHPFIYQFRQNLFDSLDFVDYFKNFYPMFLSILFIIGFIKFILRPHQPIAISAVLSIFLLAIISPKGLFGPFILIPFINYLIIKSIIEV